MDFPQHSKWNPFIVSIKGQKAVGKKIQVRMRTKKGKLMDFEPVVLKCKEEDEFRWRGKLGIKGIFDGEHYFALDPLSPNHTAAWRIFQWNIGWLNECFAKRHKGKF